jgi:hypothetical protein
MSALVLIGIGLMVGAPSECTESCQDQYSLEGYAKASSLETYNIGIPGCNASIRVDLTCSGATGLTQCGSNTIRAYGDAVGYINMYSDPNNGPECGLDYNYMYEATSCSVVLERATSPQQSKIGATWTVGGHSEDWFKWYEADTQTDCYYTPCNGSQIVYGYAPIEVSQTGLTSYHERRGTANAEIYYTDVAGVCMQGQQGDVAQEPFPDPFGYIMPGAMMTWDPELNQWVMSTGNPISYPTSVPAESTWGDPTLSNMPTWFDKNTSGTLAESGSTIVDNIVQLSAPDPEELGQPPSMEPLYTMNISGTIGQVVLFENEYECKFWCSIVPNTSIYYEDFVAARYAIRTILEFGVIVYFFVLIYRAVA